MNDFYMTFVQGVAIAQSLQCLMIWGLDYSNRLLDLKWLCHAYGLLRIFQLNSLLEQSNWAIEIKNASKIFNIHYL